MLRNYFTIGWRTLQKQKMYSAIKIGGFAVGIASCLLIGLFIRHELSYDQHFPDADLIYRVVGNYQIKGETVRNVYFPSAMERVLEDDFPEIDIAGQFVANELLGTENTLVRPAEKNENRYEKGCIYADQGLMRIFQPQFVQGDATKVLTGPHSVIISHSKADDYFPGEDPMGKTLVFRNDSQHPFTVEGVYEDFPTTSHFQYDFILSDAVHQSEDYSFQGSNLFHTYIKVRDGTNMDELQQSLKKGILETYMLAKWEQEGIGGAKKLAQESTLELQPVNDIHLKSLGIQDGLQHGNIRFVWLFGTIATFILLIASINFINLATAKSANRAREVGMRKVLGSRRSELVQQFLTESGLFSLIAFFLALFLAILLLPYFNELAGQSLLFPWSDVWFLLALAVIAILVGIISGLYPSIYLSSFQPIKVLKGGLSRGSKSAALRNVLVIVQFTISIVMIVGTIVIYQQLHFMLTKDLGFRKEQVLLVEGSESLGVQLASFKGELRHLSDIDHVSASDYLPVSGTKRNGASFYLSGKSESQVGGQLWYVDDGYIQTMGLSLLDGRNFDQNRESDLQATIVNHTMAQQLGLDHPVGEQITLGDRTLEIIGMVEDFHYESLLEKIDPLCLVMGQEGSIVAVKVHTDNLASVLSQVEELWKRFSPGEPFQYTFLNESFALMYQDVERMGRVFTSFAILAIFIACLGLFALSAFMEEQRSKEISIRLVLGASLNSIVRLLTQSYVFLVVVALALASPVGWYMMHRWLEDYQYRVQVGWEVFIYAGGLALFMALFTVSFQSIKAAFANPVEVLRNE